MRWWLQGVAQRGGSCIFACWTHLCRDGLGGDLELVLRHGPEGQSTVQYELGNSTNTQKCCCHGNNPYRALRYSTQCCRLTGRCRQANPAMFVCLAGVLPTSLSGCPRAEVGQGLISRWQLLAVTLPVPGPVHLPIVVDLLHNVDLGEQQWWCG